MPNKIPEIFSRKLIREKRNKIAKSVSICDFLHRKIAEEILDRIKPIKTNLHNIAITGANSTSLASGITRELNIENIYLTDMAINLLKIQKNNIPSNCHLITADEEYWPFKTQALDCIISNLTYHNINDLKGALIQAKMSLKPDKPIIIAVYGSQNLENIKNMLMNIEAEIIGGVYPRIAPFIEIKTLGNLLQTTGFRQITVDSEIIKIKYKNLEKAIDDIKSMGEAGILQQANPMVKKQVLEKAKQEFPHYCKNNIQVEILYAIAWS